MSAVRPLLGGTTVVLWLEHMQPLTFLGLEDSSRLFLAGNTTTSFMWKKVGVSWERPRFDQSYGRFQVMRRSADQVISCLISGVKPDA